MNGIALGLNRKHYFWFPGESGYTHCALVNLYMARTLFEPA